MSVVHGQGGNFTVSSTAYGVENWSLDIKNDAPDVTLTNSGGWVDRIVGVNDGELKIKTFWQDAVSVYTVFKSGTVITGGSLQVGGGAKAYVFTGIITGFSVETPAKGAVGVNLTAASSGVITQPT